MRHNFHHQQSKCCDLQVISFLLMLFIYSGHVNAALPEEEFFADIPEVLTATRLKQPINEAPASMTIIDRHMIEASGARDIVDVFRLVPGFQVQHENGHTPIVTYHGMSDQYSRWMQVLVDGRSIYNPSAGGVEWSHIPLVLDEIERIEVTRGPNAASFGSNAFSATINIITRHSSETNGTFFRYTAGIPNDLQDAILQYGNNVNLDKGLLDYRLTLGRLTDDGYEDRYDVMEANLARFRLDYNNGANDSWLFQSGFLNGPRGLDFGNNYDYPERNREKDIEYSFQQIKWTHSINSDEEVYIQYYHDKHVVDDHEKYVLTANPGDRMFGLLPGVTYELFNSLKTDRHDLEVQHTLVPDDSLRIAWGGSIRRDQWYSPGLISSNSTVNVDLLRLFANSEWRATDNLKVNAGAMWEDSELTGQSFSPRLGLVYRLAENHNLRFVSSKATRIPTMIEYDGRIVARLSGPALGPFPDPSEDSFLHGTKDLNHETITSVEIGLNSVHQDSELSTDIKIFRDKITDIIYFGVGSPDPLTDIPFTDFYIEPRNGEDVYIHGIEVQADMHPFQGNRIFFSYAITEIESDDIYQDYSDSAPSESFSVLVSQRFKHINSSLLLTETSGYEGLGSGNIVGEYSRVDIRIGYPFSGNAFDGEVSLVSQNISGMSIYDWAEENHMKSRHMLMVTGKFK